MLWKLIELASSQGFPAKKILSHFWGFWGLIGQLRLNFLFFQPEKGRYFYFPVLASQRFPFCIPLPNFFSFEVQDVGTAVSSTSDNSWELIVLVKTVNTLFSFSKGGYSSETATVSSLTTFSLKLV